MEIPEACPKCGSDEGYYTKDYAYGNIRTNHKFDGSIADNTEMYMYLEHKMGKYAYCSSCGKRIFKVDGSEA